MKPIINHRHFSMAVMMHILSVFIVLLLTVNTAGAQKKWCAELRSGVNFPAKELGDANLKTGFGFEGNITYRIIPNLAAYAGWGWNQFSANQSFAGNNVNFEETGYSFGLAYFLPIKNSVVNYMIRGGGIYNHIETENSSGKIINDTGHQLGWRLGTGVTIPLTNNNKWFLIPEVSYRSLSGEINMGDKATPVQLRYVSAGIGLTYAF